MRSATRTISRPAEIDVKVALVVSDTDDGKVFIPAGSKLLVIREHPNGDVDVFVPLATQSSKKARVPRRRCEILN